MDQIYCHVHDPDIKLHHNNSRSVGLSPDLGAMFPFLNWEKKDDENKPIKTSDIWCHDQDSVLAACCIVINLPGLCTVGALPGYFKL